MPPDEGAGAGVGAPPEDPLAGEWCSLSEAEDGPWFGVEDGVGALGEEPGAGSAPWEALTGVGDVAPGPELAMVLDLLDVAAVGDGVLVETVAAWERLAAWSHLGAMLTAAELSRRASMNPQWAMPLPANANVAGDELAFRLGWSRPAANRLVRDGQMLGNELLATADAVREGRVDTAKLRVLTDRLHDRPGELAWAVQDAVLPEAATRTPTQLAADVDRALLAVEPVDTADRLERAVASRHVCHPKRLPDGMAGIWAVLPADDAARVDATVEATARASRALGSPLTLDQLRADTFVALASGRALLAGTATSTTEPAGVGASPAGALTVGRGRGDEPSPAGSCDTRAAPPVRIPRVRIDVRISLTTLLGLDDEPAELAGFGPLPAQQARRLAFDAGTVWRRLVTDHLTGAVLDVGRTRYRPPAPIADHVIARDHVCAGPGCGTPATRCELDHTTEYHGVPANGSAAPGTTSAGNLGPLSDRCHRLKTDGGFTLTQVEPGVFEWHTPAGLAYRVVPGDHGRTERLDPRRSAASRGPFGGALPDPAPGYPDEPPF